MLGDVFGKITGTITDLVGGTIENIKDVASDVRPETILPIIAPETNFANTLATFGLDFFNESQRRSQFAEQINQQELNMPHVVGHDDGEVMVGGIGFENGNLGANVIGFGAQTAVNIGRNIVRGLGGAGGVAGGVAGGITGNLLMDGGVDQCGCRPKQFVRFNKCGDPIITRKMKKQAIEAVNCNGAQMAANTLTGGSLELLTAITSKQFPPMRRGISGPQLNNAARTARKLNRMHTQFQKMCKKK